jgi:hypothetical protein
MVYNSTTLEGQMTVGSVPGDTIQHSCYEGQSSEPNAVKLGYEGQSSEPKAVKLGQRDGRRPSVRPPRISPLCLPLRNHPRFEVVARSFALDSASFASSLAYSAKFWPSSLPLVT